MGVKGLKKNASFYASQLLCKLCEVYIFFFFFFGGGNLQNLLWNLFKAVVCQTKKLETKTQLGQMS